MPLADLITPSEAKLNIMCTIPWQNYFPKAWQKKEALFTVNLTGANQVPIVI